MYRLNPIEFLRKLYGLMDKLYAQLYIIEQLKVYQQRKANIRTRLKWDTKNLNHWSDTLLITNE